MNEKRKPRIVAHWEGGGEAGPARLVPGASATEAKLLEGTLDCLRRLGLRGTTSRAIAAAAGVNLGAITYHFGSKDELVAQALLSAVKGWMEPALETLRRDTDPAERLLAAVDLLRQSFERAREMVPVYLEALVAAPRHDTLRTGVEALLTEVRSLIASQLQAQKDDGYIPAWIDPDAMAMLLVSTADGIALHATLEPDAVDATTLAAQAVQLLLAARGEPSP
jgi:AcrR family transcriptional regulator